MNNVAGGLCPARHALVGSGLTILGRQEAAAAPDDDAVGTLPDAPARPDRTTRSPVIVVDRYTSATPEQVWDVLADGWLYAGWVVGASRMRGVDQSWPAVDARLHHSVGPWPALVDDTTSVVAVDPGQRLELQARGWPAGEARVVVTVETEDDGTRIRMTEDVSRGPGRFVPAPLRQLAIAPRNAESLRRLALLAEGRAA